MLHHHSLIKYIPSTERRVLRNKSLSVCLSPGQKNFTDQDRNCEMCSCYQGWFDVGNSNPGSISLGRQWLLGNRYIRISPERASRRISRGGEFEFGLNFIGVWGIDRQLIEIEFAGKKFDWGFSMEKTWIGVQLIERVMVDAHAYISSWNKDRREISRKSKRSGDLIWFPTFFL